MRRSLSSVVAVGAAVLMSITLASCATDANEITAPAVPQGTVPSQETDNSKGEETASPQPSNPQSASPETCLHGTWVADNDFFLATIREFGEEIKTVTGEVVLQFDADGKLTTDYRDWLITAVTEGIEMQIERNGVDTGTYAVEQNKISIADTDIGSKLVLKGSGLNMPVEPHPVSYSSVPFTCDATNATIETVDGLMKLVRQ